MSEFDTSDSDNFITRNLTEEATKILQDISNWREDSPDNPPCAICGEIINRGLPLRMWTENAEKEISFHFYCAFKNYELPQCCEYCKNWEIDLEWNEGDCKLGKFEKPNPYEDGYFPGPEEFYCDDWEDFRKKKLKVEWSD